MPNLALSHNKSLGPSASAMPLPGVLAGHTPWLRSFWPSTEPMASAFSRLLMDVLGCYKVWAERRGAEKMKNKKQETTPRTYVTLAT